MKTIGKALVMIARLMVASMWLVILALHIVVLPLALIAELGERKK